MAKTFDEDAGKHMYVHHAAIADVATGGSATAVGNATVINAIIDALVEANVLAID